MTISHYVSRPYEAGIVLLTDTCRVNSSTRSDSTACLASSPLDKHIAIFIVGYALMGLGVTPLYSLGYAHIDDITPRGKNSMYLAIIGTVAAVGPAAGFVLANPLLNIFVDIKQVYTEI